MKKLFTLFLAFVASAGTLFADGVKIGDLFYNLDFENKTAEVIGIDGGYSGDLVIPDSVFSDLPDIPTVSSPAYGYVTLVIEIPIRSECNGIAFKGSLDGTTWTGVNQYLGEYGPTNADNCIKFELIDGTTNWYKATFRLGDEEYMEGKICQIYNNDISWEGQAVNWYVYDPFTTVDYGKSGNDNLVIQGSGLIYLHIGGWQYTECLVEYEYNITVLTPPFCGEEFPIEIVGSFGGWDNNPAPLTKVSDGVYSATFQAYINCPIRVRGQGNWEQGIEMINPQDGWLGVYDFVLSEDTNVVMDYSDASVYRWSICGEDEEENMYAKKMNISNKPFISATNLRAFKVTGILRNAFSHCEGLASITIPSTVDHIEGGISYGCSNLETIIIVGGNTNYDSRDNCNAIIETETNTLIAGCQRTIIPNSVTSIGERAFFCCSVLTSITIPNSVTRIDSFAFHDCIGLTSIEIPNSVTSIEYCAFNGCSNLSSAIISNCVTSIGSCAFHNCSSLTYIEIPNGVTRIEDCAFNGCSGLTSIIIPNSVTSIADDAFSLTTIVVIPPQRVPSIGYAAFSQSSSLTSVTCHATTPPYLEYRVFDHRDCAEIPLYVPAQSVEAYKAADQWKDFNVQAISEDALPEILTDENLQDGKYMIDGVFYIRKDGRVYDINGIIVE